MSNDEKNVLLNIVNDDGNIIDKLQILGEGAYIGSSKNATWSTATTGELELSSDVNWDIVSADTVYAVQVVGTGNLTRAEHIASINLPTPKDVNAGDDFTVKAGLTLTISD
jgi:hypothetical protein